MNARNQRTSSSSTDTQPTITRPYITGFFAMVPLAFYLVGGLSSSAIALYEIICRMSIEPELEVHRSVLFRELGGCKRTLRRSLIALKQAGLIEHRREGRQDVIGLVELRAVRLGELRNLDRKTFSAVAEQAQETRGASALVSRAITADKRLTQTERRVMGFYLAVAGKQTGRSWWGLTTISRVLGISLNTLSRCRTRLAGFGYIRLYWTTDQRPGVEVRAPKGQGKQSRRNAGPKGTQGRLEGDTAERLSFNSKEQPGFEGRKKTRASYAHTYTREEISPVEPPPALIPVNHQALACVVEAFEEAVGEVEDPYAHQVEELVARKLREGQTAAFLIAAITAYANRASYLISASALLRNGAIEKWGKSIPNPYRKRIWVSQKELDIERELRVGGHDPKPVKTPEQQASEAELAQRWRALPMELPTCTSSPEQQDRVIEEVLKATRRAGDEALLDWLAEAVWQRRLTLDHILRYFEPSEQLRAGLDRWLRFHRSDMTFAQFKTQHGPATADATLRKA